MQNGIARAAEIAATADTGAGDIAARVAAGGWIGISRAMLQIAADIQEIRGRLDDVADLVRRARTPVQAVPARLTPQQTIDALTPAVGLLADIQDRIRGTLLRVGEVHQHAARTLRGGRPAMMLAGIDGIRQVLIAVGQRTNAAATKVDAALAVARDAGAADSARLDRAPASASGAAAYHPGFLEQLPVRHHDTDPTDGVLTTTDGKKISSVLSGKTGPGQGGPLLRGRWRYEVAAVDHAEGHAAAVMRTRGIMNATLYLNNPPCDYPRGCDKLLPALLPEGARLTVYARGMDEPKVYVGTGRGVQR
jgi:hypothetical protein